MTAVFPRRYRVLVRDSLTGSVVVSDLPHTDLDFELRGMQAGATGQNLIGQFHVKLWPPGSSEHRAATEKYAKLKINQRVEIYRGFGLGGASDASLPFGGPVFSGLVRGLPISLVDYQLTGVDSLQVLQQSRTGRTEYLNTFTDGIAAFALRNWQLAFGDDFSGAYGSLGANYTATGTWLGNVADEGLSTAFTQDTGADRYLLGTQSFTAAQYEDCVARCWFKIQPSNGVGQTTRVGIVAAGVVVPGTSFTNDYVQGSLLIKCVSATEWDIDVQLSRFIPGVQTVTKRVSLVFNVPTNLFRCQLQLVGKRGSWDGTTFTPSSATQGSTATFYMWRLLVNGVDSNCWIVTDYGLTSLPTGPIGINWNATAGSGQPQLNANRLIFRTRTAAFQRGNFQTGARKIAQYFSRSPNLDVLQQAAVVEGYAVRKRPMAGVNQDQIDFGAPTAIFNDYSLDALAGGAIFELPPIHLVESVNLESASLEPMAESPASEVSLQLSPGSDNAGMIEWDNIAAEKQFGILTSAVNAQYVSDFLAARVLADQMVAISGNPGVAKKATVVLDGENDFFGSANDECAPGDWVSFSSPRLGLVKQRVQVVTLRFTESKATIDATFDSYPLDSTELQLRRLWATLDALAAGVASLSPTTGTATVYDNAYGAPNVMTCYSGYWPVDATHNLQLKFAFPRNIVMIQRITLTFFLFSYLAGIQATTAGVTSAAGSSHNHSVSGQTASSTTSSAGSAHTHSITIASASGGGGGALGVDASGTLYSTGFSGSAASTNTEGAHTHPVPSTSVTGATATSESSHTHTVPSASLNAPTSLQAGVGGATGVHVIIDGTDQTSALGGPFTTDTQELDITPYVLGGGSHTVELTSTALGGISAQIQAFTLAKSI